LPSENACKSLAFIFWVPPNPATVVAGLALQGLLLIGQYPDFLRAQASVVDPDIIEQSFEPVPFGDTIAIIVFGTDKQPARIGVRHSSRHHKRTQQCTIKVELRLRSLLAEDHVPPGVLQTQPIDVGCHVVATADVAESETNNARLRDVPRWLS
jgi:hypothetical protein